MSLYIMDLFGLMKLFLELYKMKEDEFKKYAASNTASNKENRAK